ncbi:unnamed protein product [Danaus chrysippus]|uniref:(African queen) hypothetical protein n=1 Tax=Danaus chrysippus TaxID=151541 RepID=A0A8J2R7V9_9NEOP|nr:unnamed protein product [Danaus chrysippus]
MVAGIRPNHVTKTSTFKVELPQKESVYGINNCKVVPCFDQDVHQATDVYVMEMMEMSSHRSMGPDGTDELEPIQCTELAAQESGKNLPNRYDRNVTGVVPSIAEDALASPSACVSWEEFPPAAPAAQMPLLKK